MRILFLAPQPFYQPRGTPIAEKALLTTLSGQGHRTTVVTYHEGRDVTIDGCRIYRIPTIPAVEDIEPGFSLKKLICDLFLFVEALRLAGSDDYHLVHAVEESVFIAMVIERIHGIPYVYDMDSSLAEQLLDQLPWLEVARGMAVKCEELAIRGSAGVLVVCRYLEERVREIAPDAVVRRAEDFSLLEEASAGEERLSETIGRNGPIVLYVGNLAPYQGIDLLIDSWPFVARSVPDAQLVIVGGGDERIRTYREEARRRDVAESVHFVGPRPLEQLGDLLRQAQVLVSPRTRGRNTPMKIYSYLDSGTPVVATRRLTHTQVLDDDIAVLVDAEPEAFGRGIARLLVDDELGERLAGAARVRVREEYSREAFERKVGQFYRRLPVEEGNGGR